MLAVIFPGQGSQTIGMAKDFYDNFNIVKKTFSEIGDSTKIDLYKLIFEDPDKKLNITEFTQISIYCVSISIFLLIKELYKEKFLNKIDFMAGHSLGEYSALSASNSLSLNNCANILKLRGQYMQNSYPQNQSGMLAVIGLEISKIEEILLNLDEKDKFEIANDNAPGQVVISLAKENFDYISDQLKSFGAKKTIPLNVSSGFHSSFMRKAEKEMIHKLENLDINDSEYTIVSNYNVQPVRKKNEIIDNLKKQITNRVRWVETIKYFESKNVNTIIEIGPNKILNGLNKRISSNFTLINVSNINELENLKNVI